MFLKQLHETSLVSPCLLLVLLLTLASEAILPSQAVVCVQYCGPSPPPISTSFTKLSYVPSSLSGIALPLNVTMCSVLGTGMPGTKEN